MTNFQGWAQNKNVGLLLKKEGKSFSFLSLDVLWCFLYLLLCARSGSWNLWTSTSLHRHLGTALWSTPVLSEEWAVESLSWGGRRWESGPQASWSSKPQCSLHGLIVLYLWNPSSKIKLLRQLQSTKPQAWGFLLSIGSMWSHVCPWSQFCF